MSVEFDEEWPTIFGIWVTRPKEGHSSFHRPIFFLPLCTTRSRQPAGPPSFLPRSFIEIRNLTPKEDGEDADHIEAAQICPRKITKPSLDFTAKL